MHSRRVLQSVGSKFVGIWLLACGTTGDASDTFSVHDSAGVAIAVSERPEWRAGTEWRIDPEPSLEIGVEAGDEAYELNRVFDAVRFPDGRVFVGNSGSSEIRVFDAEGRFIRSIGRRGNGPGEFSTYSSIRVVRAADGSFVAYDAGNLRVHHFDSSGTYQRTVRIQSTSDGLRAFFLGLFSDGSWLTLALHPELRNEPGTYLRSAQQFVRFGADGTPHATLRHVEGRTRFVHKFGSIVHFPFVPFTAEPVATPAVEWLLVLPSGAAEFETRDLEGRLRRVVRLRLAVPQTAEVYKRYVESSLATMDTVRRAQYEHFYSISHPLPDRIPAFQALLVDADSNVWLERYRLPGDTTPRWDVVAPTGRWLGPVTAPPRLRVFQIGKEFVLGRHLDSLGVERVRIHPLMRHAR